MNVARNKTLLFADDEPELLEIYGEWFKRLGYRVLSAGNGREAFSICRAQHVDLVISDVRMVGGDGIELAQQLKSTPESTPLIVFLTGFADVSSEEAYDLGVCAILNKPIERTPLQNAVQRFLKSPHELWAAPLNSQMNAFVRKNYCSLESALEKRELSFGRGGMFVRSCETLPEDVPVGFQFTFAEGKTPRMDVCGILRWQRPQPDRDLPPGIGVEILRLGDQALDPVIEWIGRANPRAFIPRQ